MVYFSVDNDHHTSLALLLIQKAGLNREDVTFISHRSPRNRIAESSGYRAMLINVHPLCSGRSFKDPRSYWHSWLHQKDIKRQFGFQADDELVITTEYEINNALLAKQMQHAGGRVRLYDEGIGFYFNNSPFHDQHTSWIDNFYLALFNFAFMILRIPAYARKGFEGRMYVRIQERHLDAIYSRMKLPISRPAKIRGYRHFLVSEDSFAPKASHLALFFANNLDAFGMKSEELMLSEVVLRHMASVFAEVHLKIHPADCAAQNDVHKFYLALANEHENIHLVDNGLPGDAVMEKLKPRIVVGTMGAALFDGFFFGSQPIFLFHLLPPLKAFEVCRDTLDGLGYRYIESIKDILPKYECGIDISTLVYGDDKNGDAAVEGLSRLPRKPALSFHTQDRTSHG